MVYTLPSRSLGKAFGDFGKAALLRACEFDPHPGHQDSF